jgi:hypothetical protein
MKRPLLLTAFLLFCSYGLVGQKAALFTYDCNKVTMIMDQINESNTTSGSVFTLLADTTKVSPTSNFGYFALGCVPAFAFSVGGFYAGIYLSPDSYAGLVIGLLVGLIVPVVAVSFKTKNPDSRGYTFLGSVIGGTIPVLAIYLMNKAWSNFLASNSGCLN